MKKRTYKITENFIRKLKPPKKGQVRFFSQEIRGWAVAIAASGHVTFVLDFVDAHYRQHRIRFGEWPVLSAQAAWNKAVDLKREIAEGVNPLDCKDQARRGVNVRALAGEYVQKYARSHKRPGSIKFDLWMLDQRILPALGSLKVAATSRQDIERLHQSLRETPYLANRVRSLLAKMFALAELWGYRTGNPCRGIQRFKEYPRERYLTASEQDQLEGALSEYDHREAADAVRLILCTGARKGEVVGARWENFDLDSSEPKWVMPHSSTKQDKAHVFPLEGRALALLRRMAKHSTRAGYLFPGRRAGKPGIQNLQKHWETIREKAELQAVVDPTTGKKRPVRIHDLRHTFAANLKQQGVDLQVVGKLLGHARFETTLRYAHVSDQTLTAGLEKVSRARQARKRKRNK